MKRILSMGAGVQTTACLVRYYYEYDAVVFADTGDEKAETYRYIEEVLKPYCNKRDIQWVTVRSEKAATLLDYCKERKMMPTRMNRFCTREFKIRPIRIWLRQNGATAKNPITVDLGISADELHRVNSSKYAVKYEIKNYPLIKDRITRRDCEEIIAAAGLPRAVKSGCDYCPFIGKKRVQRLARADPERYAKVVAMEEGAKNFPKYTLFEGVTLRELERREMSNSTLDSVLECDSGHCFV